ncbi:ankyrin [Piromyces finnis]|uniref:Ankyrin n=1 Tax=Piromyces finnis TaxID=1754191 RepID=A0A1Y1V0E1_9FUNG|nr:ankyrin [Piromyces finnis]|eukprot:ORX44527.1 ankyrin [Piromyces finnis]
MDSKVEGKKRTKNAISQNNSVSINASNDSLNKNHNEMSSATLGEMVFYYVNNGDMDGLLSLFDDCNKKSQTTLLLQTLLSLSYPNTERLYDFEQQYQNEAAELLGPSVNHLNAIQIACILEDEDMSLAILEFVSKATLEMNAKKVLYEFMGSTWGNGNTLLHLASFLCMADLVRRLLELGANVNRKNERKYKPVDCTNDYNVMDIFLTTTEIKETNIVAESLSSNESISTTADNTNTNQNISCPEEHEIEEKENAENEDNNKESWKNEINIPGDSRNGSIDNDDNNCITVKDEVKEEIKMVEEESKKIEEKKEKEDNSIPTNTTKENSDSKPKSSLKSALKSENSPKKKARICFDALTSFLYMCQYGDPTEDPELPTVRKYLGIPSENGEEINNVEIPECFKDQIPISKEVLSSLYTAHNFLTPLHIAATYNQLGIVKLLVEYADAPVNIQDVEGWTPLHCACAEGNFDIVEYLGRCTKRKYYENALKQTETDDENEITEDDKDKYKGYNNDYHIFEYTEKNPIFMKKSGENKEEDDDDDDDDEKDDENDEEEENDEERYADICDDYITITNDIYRLLLKESNGVEDTDKDKPSVYCVDGPILLDILNEDGNNAYEVCQEDPKGQLIQIHLKNLIVKQQELIKLAMEKKDNEPPEVESDSINNNISEENEKINDHSVGKSKLNEVIYTTTLNDTDEQKEEDKEEEKVEEEKEEMKEDKKTENEKTEEEKPKEIENNKNIEINPQPNIKISDMSEITSTITPINHKVSAKNNIMIEVALNSLDKKEGKDEIRQFKRSSLEKRLSESLDNLKMDKNDLYYNNMTQLQTTDNHHARPCSLMLPRGLCGSDMALNAKGSKRIIPTFNLSLTEGGIKPFNRSHRNNNVIGPSVSFGNGTQSCCYSPGVTSPNNDINMNKLYRRSIQTYSSYNTNSTATDFDFSKHKNGINDSLLKSKQTNSEIESYENNSFKDTSVDSSTTTNGNRRSLSNRASGKVINADTVIEETDNIKESNESLKSNESNKSNKSNKSEDSNKKSSRISINAKKMFFLSFKKKKTQEENQEQQKDILVSTMKKRYEKNSSKAQK